MRGSAPLTRSSTRSSVRSPPPPPQQNVVSPMVSGAMSTNLSTQARMISRGIVNCPPGTPPMREARDTLHESWNVTTLSAFPLLSSVIAPRWMRSYVTSQMCCGAG
ncbi:MAG: hypothetical protein K0S03_2272 [Burkholderiales bacterium]|nr:hypothetical protein [Burkholderiales bacterium]